ncbi:hypothetical protein GCM10009555_077370 [Acrocarpospora macrocephala]|uniref:DUF4276 family protein n=1 Tax=Acrocarpospora macrocephala TaxID=150177 RepID=A0A5M3X748_9ACTN|nr:DUF4276 family protein [Acrocarpospora macrocephala]GES15989.1 hypothetical protein Amac_095870 [Acrocarpospora macrocephala]
MSGRVYTGFFVGEGTSDLPLADIVETLFIDRGTQVRLSKPDFESLKGVRRDVRSKVSASIQLVGGPVDLVVVHRDADNAGADTRRNEIEEAVHAAGHCSSIVPVIPVRMTEAWLLLDEQSIRTVAGNPKGKMNLGLPASNRVEREPDPKQLLKECLLKASDATGRRRERAANRFYEHRRHLLQRLDCAGPVTSLPSWKRLVADIESVIDQWNGREDL